MSDRSTRLLSERTYRGLFFPGYEAVASLPSVRGTGPGMSTIASATWNSKDERSGWRSTRACWGSTTSSPFDDKQIFHWNTRALMSKVMSTGNGRIKFWINELAAGRKKSVDRGVSRFLSRVRACSTSRSRRTTSVRTVRDLQAAAGCGFLEHSPRRTMRRSSTAWDASTRISHRSPSSACSSIATTRDTSSRSSAIRCRTGRRSSTRSFSGKARVKSFGAGNFKALFESIEREQAKRGNL